MILFDGTGGEYTAEVAEVSKKRVDLMLQQHHALDKAPGVDLHLGLCIIKRDAMDTAIQKATELGVSHIHPLVSERVSVPAKQYKTRADHWLGVVRSACEQCGMNRVPEISEPMELSSWVNHQTGMKLCGIPGSEAFSWSGLPGQESFSILVGPEGGFAQAEVRAIQDAGFSGVNLGPRILRAETAVVTLLTLATHFSQSA